MDFETGFDSEILNLKRGEPLRSLSAVSFEMRCPNCHKLYSVSPQVFSSDEDDVIKFECVACEAVFLTIKPEERTSGTLSSRSLETLLAPLADWGEKRASHARNHGSEPAKIARTEISITPTFSPEPSRVAIEAVPLRPHPVEDFEMAQSAEILGLWQAVVEKYEDFDRHKRFLDRCFAEQKLTFAAYKYTQVLMVDPQDKIARRMRNEAVGLASYGFDGASAVMSPSTWSLPLASFNSLILCLGAIAVVVGLGLPHMRSVAAIGASMIAIAMSLRTFLRRPL